MARPTKQGVDYFPLDINLNSKFKFIESKYGLEGFAIAIKLFQLVYSQGYWTKFDDDEKTLFAYEVKADINLVNDVLMEALSRDLFNKRMFQKYEILTSKGIQERYQAIVKRRKDVEVVSNYLLIDGSFGVNVNINEINVNKNSSKSRLDVSKSTQSKVKESKVNKSKVKERKDSVLSNDNMSVETDPPLEIKNKINELHFKDYENILDYWNNHSLLPKIREISPKRKTHVNARFKEHGLEAIFEVISNCNKSKFMRGENQKNWTASFDWVFSNPNNYIKVLEGNYVDKNVMSKEERIYRQTMKDLEGVN